jgi:hypothetical protein
MSDSKPAVQKVKKRVRSRTDILLVFDPAQKVPDPVLNAIVNEWLIPTLVEEEFLCDRGFTQHPPHSLA